MFKFPALICVLTLFGLLSGCAQVSAPMPAGFPEPTPEGLIEIKTYPVVRGARVRVQGAYERSTGRAFGPLFRHISAQAVPMTAPVITDYQAAAPSGNADVFFLYADTAQGQTGTYPEAVEVMDLAAGAWLSIGVRGPYDHPTFTRALKKLDDWLYLHSSEYQVSGPPRRLYYNDPFRLPWLLFSDVQVPITPRSQGLENPLAKR